MIRSILGVEMRSMINYMKALSDAKKVVCGLLAAVIALFILPSVVSVLSIIILGAGEEGLGGFMLLLSLAAVLILTLLAVNSIIKEMFMDRNIQLYLTFPVSPAALFAAKFIRQWLINTALIMGTLGIITGVLFSMREGQWLLTVTHIFYFLLLSIVAMSLAYGLVFAVTKVLPANKVSEVLSFLGGISFVLVYGVLLVGGSSVQDISGSLPDASFLYSGFLYNFNPASGLAGLVVSAALAAGLVVLLRSFVVHAFKSGWVGEQSVKRRNRDASSDAASPVRTLVQKDMRMTLRDFKEWAVLLPQYLLPGVMIFIMYTNPAAIEGDSSMHDARMIAVSVAGTVVISLFAGAYNTARDAAHFEFLKIMPVKPADLVKAKYLFNIMTITPVYLLAAVVAWMLLPVSTAAFLYSSLFIILVSLAVIPAGMFAGSMQPVVSRKNPAKRLDTATNVILSVIMGVLLIAAGFISVLFARGDGGLDHLLIAIVLSVLVVSAGVSLLFLRAVRKRYEKGFNIIYKD